MGTNSSNAAPSRNSSVVGVVSLWRPSLKKTGKPSITTVREGLQDMAMIMLTSLAWPGIVCLLCTGTALLLLLSVIIPLLR
jgi:hypothetical protein